MGAWKLLVHPDFYLNDDDEDGPWEGPQTPDEYKNNRSTKLDAAVQIIVYHFRHPAAPPLINKYADAATSAQPGSAEYFDNALIPDRSRIPSCPPQGPVWDTTTPDKQIVYCFFAAQMMLLERVSTMQCLFPSAQQFTSCF